MDEHFVKKVYRTIIYTWALAVVWSVALGELWIALSITLGVILSTVVLATYDVVIRRLFTPGTNKPRFTLIIVIAVKYVFIGIALYFLVRWQKIDLLAFCGGVFLVHLAILAKLAGVKIVERREQRKRDDASGSIPRS